MTHLIDLPKRYPELFERHPYDKGEDNLAFHFGCGDGWFALLDCLLHSIKQSLGRYRQVVKIKKDIIERGDEPPPWIVKYFEETPEDPLASFSIAQIKEKFGGLRFYWDCDVKGFMRGQVDGAATLTEDLSCRVCEDCGSPGRTRNLRWLRTLCDTHYDETVARLKKEKANSGL